MFLNCLGPLIKYRQNSSNILKEQTDSEIRIKTGSDIYRIFCCFDSDNIVILFHGFQKKGQKIPKKEISKAVCLKNEYFKNRKD